MTRFPQLLVIYAAVSWGLVGALSRYLSAAGFSFAEMAFIRCLIAAAGLFGYLFLKDRNAAKINLRHSWVFLFQGSVGVALCFIFYFMTANTVTLSATTILLYTAPYMVMAISAVVYREKITLQKVGALLLAFSGCVMTVGIIDRSALPLEGILTGLGAALCYALYTIFGKAGLEKGYAPVTITAYSYTVASISLIPLCNFQTVAAIIKSDNSTLFYLLIFGVFFTLLPYLSYMKGLERLDSGKASIIAFVEPLTAAAAGLFVFNELLSAIKIAGMCLILLSLIILNLKRTEKL